MNYILNRSSITLTFILAILLVSLNFSSCSKQKEDSNTLKISISEAEIIAFQKAYGISFNAISQSVEDNSYYETAARKHIDKNYNIESGEFMFKIGNETSSNYRSTYDGILSYFIGKNKAFPNDKGITKQNWRKIDWNNNGIIKDGDMAIVMGQATLTNQNGETRLQNYTMCLKKTEGGNLKLIAHKIAKPC